MEKRLLSLVGLYEITIKFVEKMVGENKKETDWIDQPTGKANGRNVVSDILLQESELDGYGNRTNKFRKIYLPKDDILKLADLIRDTEESEVVGWVDPDDDLTW